MTKSISVLISTFCALASTAFAQVAPSKATQNMVGMCVLKTKSDIVTPETACACGAAVLGGMLTQQEYGVMGELVLHLDDEAPFNSKIADMMENDVSQMVIQNVGVKMVAIAERNMPRICQVLEKPIHMTVDTQFQQLMDNPTLSATSGTHSSATSYVSKAYADMGMFAFDETWIVDEAR